MRRWQALSILSLAAFCVSACGPGASLDEQRRQLEKQRDELEAARRQLDVEREGLSGERQRVEKAGAELAAQREQFEEEKRKKAPPRKEERPEAELLVGQWERTGTSGWLVGLRLGKDGTYSAVADEETHKTVSKGSFELVGGTLKFTAQGSAWVVPTLRLVKVDEKVLTLREDGAEAQPFKRR